MPPLKFLFRTVNGLEEIASQEILEKLKVNELIFAPYGPHGWIKCEIEDNSENIRRLRGINEAHVILQEESYSRRFSIDRFADLAIERMPLHAPSARRISVSAFSSFKRPNQREIQGAFSKRIREKLNAECNLKNYDTALRVMLLRKAAIATIDLEIQPGNLPKKMITHPTPLLPPIAYCMIRLAAPQKNEQLLDPMCGCGTIPLMAAIEWKGLKVVGLDIEDGYLSSARRNAETLGITDRIEFVRSDIADLANTGIVADMIVVNPPYGMTVPARNRIEKLYGTLLQTSIEVLSSNGRMIVITPYPRIIGKEAQQAKMKIDFSYRIREGDPPRTLQVIRRA
nr:methyltransferase [Candidatus Njordarchaeota archaeon]